MNLDEWEKKQGHGQANGKPQPEPIDEPPGGRPRQVHSEANISLCCAAFGRDLVWKERFR